MRVVTCTELKKNLERYLEEINASGEGIHISYRRKVVAVMLPVRPDDPDYVYLCQLCREHEEGKNKEMFAQINAAYADEPDAVEKDILRKSRSQHRRIVKREW
jgi:antitoxin (DNA-binding transcriptional repressor) of toxin-antitoxin stability system